MESFGRGGGCRCGQARGGSQHSENYKKEKKTKEEKGMPGKTGLGNLGSKIIRGEHILCGPNHPYHSVPQVQTEWCKREFESFRGPGKYRGKQTQKNSQSN